MNRDLALTVVFPAQPARPAPRTTQGLRRWLTTSLFGDVGRLAITVAIVVVAALLLPALLDWALLKAVFIGDSHACRAVAGQGACWAVIGEKFRPILFGRYPFAEHWRAALATVLLLGALFASFGHHGPARRLATGWIVVLALVLGVLGGGWGGLSDVPSALWGGLPLTLLLSVGTVAGAWPLSILLALGRRSQLPAIRNACVFFIEILRAVPLVSVLLLAAFLLPLFMPQGVSIDVLFRVWVGLVAFAAAYLAEVLRGGLQSIPKGQLEAAAALGLGYWHTQLHIALPQAIRATVPALMNSFISIIKETSLVTVVSLYELTGALTLALSGDLDWREFYVECYLFTAAIYWLICFSLSRYSRRRAARVDAASAR